MALMKLQRNKPEIKPMLTKFYGVIWSYDHYGGGGSDAYRLKTKLIDT